MSIDSVERKYVIVLHIRIKYCIVLFEECAIVARVVEARARAKFEADSFVMILSSVWSMLRGTSDPSKASVDDIIAASFSGTAWSLDLAQAENDPSQPSFKRCGWAASEMIVTKYQQLQRIVHAPLYGQANLGWTKLTVARGLPSATPCYHLQYCDLPQPSTQGCSQFLSSN
jgi:hypothetical protein